MSTKFGFEYIIEKNKDVREKRLKAIHIKVEGEWREGVILKQEHTKDYLMTYILFPFISNDVDIVALPLDSWGQDDVVGRTRRRL